MYLKTQCTFVSFPPFPCVNWMLYVKQYTISCSASRICLKLLWLQRRHALEEWMQKLLSDIDLSRSAPVAAFLELEAAARSCMCYLINF
jgi:hypothetical protein